MRRRVAIWMAVGLAVIVAAGVAAALIMAWLRTS